MKLIERFKRQVAKEKAPVIEQSEFYPNHESFRSTSHDQAQSLFFSHLPEEIRQAIYVEIWRSAGLSQHIFRQRIPEPEEPARKWKKKNRAPPLSSYRFTHYKCITEFQIGDERQRGLGDKPAWIRIWMDHPKGSLWTMRYASPWTNHWKCWEHLMGDKGQRSWEDWHANLDDLKAYYSGKPHLFPPLSFSTRDPFLPMLSTCKRLYLACIRSIYETITFSFTDILTTEEFIGCCLPRPRRLDHCSSPFALYTRKINLSLGCRSPKDISCVQNHSPWDFHWVGLASMKHLQQVNIWVDRYAGNPSCESGPWWKGLGAQNFNFVGAALKSQLRPGMCVIMSIPMDGGLPCHRDEDSIFNEKRHRAGFVIWSRQGERALLASPTGRFLEADPDHAFRPSIL